MENNIGNVEFFDDENTLLSTNDQRTVDNFIFLLSLNDSKAQEILRYIKATHGRHYLKLVNELFVK